MGSGDHKKILIIKHGALGDIIQGLDAFASVRQGNVSAHIGIMTTPAFVSLMRGMPWFDEVIIDPRASIFRLKSSLYIRRQIRRDWTCVIDMQCSRRTNRYHQFYSRKGTRWIGTAQNCSDPLPDFTGVNNRDRMIFSAKCANGIETNADLSWLVGDGQDFDANSLDIPKKKFVVFVSGCSPHRPEKRWSANHFAIVGKFFISLGYDVVLVGTLADESTVSEIMEHLPSASNLCGKTSIQQLTTLCAKSELVVGNDTGPIFLAAKTGTRTLVLMGPATIPDAMRPVQDNSFWLHESDINAITPDQVIHKIKSMMGLN
jgi:ADP-heptose:LPS heptosyltransferase